MIPAPVHELMKARQADPSALPVDEGAFFWVDWSEDDDQIPGACEDVLKTGQLSAEWIDDGLAIVWRGERTLVPLKVSIASRLSDSFLFSSIAWAIPFSLGNFLPWLSRENRDITLRTLNQVLLPDYEIRRVVDPAQASEAAYLPRRREAWQALEEQYGSGFLATVFAPIGSLAATDDGSAAPSAEG